MKQIRFDRFGRAADVLTCVEVPDPPPPGHGEVKLAMLRMPINPSDLLQTDGRYGAVQPQLPVFPGREGVGRVVELGAGISGLSIGDTVVVTGGPTWRSQMVCRADTVIPLPPGTDFEQAAMLRANPGTALLMLRSVPLGPGDWVIQNAANSAVGTYLARLAARAGIGTVSLVRRAEAGAHLHGVKGAVVVVHDGQSGEQLAEQVRAATGGATAKLGIDAIAGPATEALACCLGEGATLLNYGLLSGKPCEISPKHLIFRQITLRGFWVSKWYETSEPSAKLALFGELLERLRDGTLAVKIAARYPLERIGEAAAHAAQEARGGKILLSGE